MATTLLRSPSRKNLGNLSKNVLVVEDDSDIAEAVLVGLNQAGYGARIAKSRDEAITAVIGNLYHFILMDYGMPGMSADAFVKFVRNKSPLTTIILVSAYIHAPETARQLGLKYWVGKPFSLDSLIDSLKTICP